MRSGPRRGPGLSPGWKAMDTARYVLGVLLVVGLPPAIGFWLLIHPLIRLWRRIGPGATYTVAVVVWGVLALSLYRFRATLLGTDLGTSWILIPPGLALYGASAWMSFLTRRQLRLSIFAGLPELSVGGAGGSLLEDGMYGVVRHPRYLSVIVGTVGYSLCVNYLGAYLMVLGSLPALYLVIVFEERELARRFGAGYERYRSGVPMLLPRFPRKKVLRRR